MNLVVMGQAAEPVIIAAASSAPGCASCSISLSESSAHQGQNMDESFKRLQVRMAGQSRRLMSYLEHLPICKSRSEALHTALIYVIHVNPSPSQESVQEQLNHYGYILNELRQQNRRLRPSRAILLVRTASADSDLGNLDCGYEGNWQEEIEEFEAIHNNIDRAGPVSVNDAVALRKLFESIAVTKKNRLSVSQGSDSEGSNTSLPPPLYEAECESDFFTPEQFEAKPAPPPRGRVSL